MSKILSFLNNNSNELESLVEQYRALDREIKRLTLDANLIKANIITGMGTSETVENKAGHVIATYKEYSREDFDRKSFQAMCPEQYEVFVQKSTYKMFKLK